MHCTVHINYTVAERGVPADSENKRLKNRVSAGAIFMPRGGAITVITDTIVVMPPRTAKRVASTMQPCGGGPRPFEFDGRIYFDSLASFISLVVLVFVPTRKKLCEQSIESERWPHPC
jgi:hypothetical protein